MRLERSSGSFENLYWSWWTEVLASSLHTAAALALTQLLTTALPFFCSSGLSSVKFAPFRFRGLPTQTRPDQTVSRRKSCCRSLPTASPRDHPAIRPARALVRRLHRLLSCFGARTAAKRRILELGNETATGQNPRLRDQISARRAWAPIP